MWITVSVAASGLMIGGISKLQAQEQEPQTILVEEQFAPGDLAFMYVHYNDMEIDQYLVTKDEWWTIQDTIHGGAIHVAWGYHVLNMDNVSRLQWKPSR